MEVTIMVLLGVVFFIGLVWNLLKRVNGWVYERKLGDKRFLLPPGDLGWPFLGNMLTFLRHFKSTDPDSFANSYVQRYGRTGIYKAFMFGNPSVIVTTPETCKRVLTDNECFIPGWPESTVTLIGEKSFIAISMEEHARLRKLTAAPINGQEALSLYLKFIDEKVVSALDKWSKMGQIELLSQLRKLTFRIIMHIFMSTESEQVMETLENEYTVLNYGVRSMAINIPGFAYHKALKSRKKLVSIFQSVVDRRRKRKSWDGKKGDMMDALLEVVDDKGRKLGDDDIIDILVMYLNAGHESSGHTAMWAVFYLHNHPEIFRKAKAEQEAIVKNRPPGQKHMSLKEYRTMQYTSQVIDETLRLVTFSLMVFREATKDVKINGYLIPKGWKVLTWFRSVHFDSDIYSNPKEFDPSRWDGYTPKVGSFLPFGAGARLCPGNDLAKLEISVFLHHYLLGYEFQRENPDSKIMYLPHPRPIDNCLGRMKKVSP